MKLKNRYHFPLLISLLVFIVVIQACNREARILSLELEISELICRDGQNAYEARILELEGIKTVISSFETHKTQISYRENQVSEAVIKDHLALYGFTLNGVPGDLNSRNRLPSCCRGDIKDTN